MSASDVEAQIARAEASIEAGDLQAARAAAEEIVAGDPLQPAAHNVLGFLAYREGRLIDAQREFELACSLPGADDDARANLALVRRELAAVYAESGAVAPASPEPAAPPASSSAGPTRTCAAAATGPTSRPRCSAACSALRSIPSSRPALDQLVTATTMNERRFLLRFAAHFWDGRGDVFENGPLLGGTTRALALGMLANSARDPGAELHTHDWFTTTVPLDLPPGTWEQMIAKGPDDSRPVRGDDASPARSSPSTTRFTPAGTTRRCCTRTSRTCRTSPATRRATARRCSRRPSASSASSSSTAARAGTAPSTGSSGSATACRAAATSSSRTTAGTRASGCRRSSARCPSTSGSSPTSTTPTRSSCCARSTAATLDAHFPDDPRDVGVDGFDDVFLRLGVDAGDRSDVRSMVALTIQHAGALAVPRAQGRGADPHRRDAQPARVRPLPAAVHRPGAARADLRPQRAGRAVAGLRPPSLARRRGGRPRGGRAAAPRPSRAARPRRATARWSPTSSGSRRAAARRASACPCARSAAAGG